MKKAQPEFLLQIAVCDYLRRKYPAALFDNDAVGFSRLTLPQQARLKRIRKDGFKRPDLAIYEPRHGYHGMFIELKSKCPFRKDGIIRSDSHLEGQLESINGLQHRGYHASFQWDFDEITKLIDWYLQ